MEFSRVERAAIEAILSKPVDGMEVARAQFAAASVTARDYTGVGFYTTISVPSSVPPMPDSKELHDALFYGAGGRAKSDPQGWVFFILWARKGYLVCLEGCTVRDSWPNEDDIEDIAPCEVCRDKRLRSPKNAVPCEIRKGKRKWFPQDNLIPDCENRFAVWQSETSGVSLLVRVVVALVLIAVAIAALLAISAAA